MQELFPELDLILVDEHFQEQPSSTVVQVEEETITLLREGVLPIGDLYAILEKTRI
jgi:tRNA A37 threonylcarbamoyladenosine synthetase subunit TsaC/SUA5/YrdC